MTSHQLDMQRLLYRLAFIILLSVSTGCFIQANWIQAKAWLAQYLIANAWQETLAAPGVTNNKPWGWADFWPVARLVWQDKDQHEELYVLSGASGQSLAFGPGHMSESALPGSAGQVVIAGHKDSHFAFLKQAAIGDTLLLENSNGQQKHYRIIDKKIVNADQQQLSLQQKDELLLITCYPFNTLVANGPLRLVVTARPV